MVNPSDKEIAIATITGTLVLVQKHMRKVKWENVEEKDLHVLLDLIGELVKKVKVLPIEERTDLHKQEVKA